MLLVSAMVYGAVAVATASVVRRRAENKQLRVPRSAIGACGGCECPVSARLIKIGSPTSRGVKRLNIGLLRSLTKNDMPSETGHRRFSKYCLSL